MQSEYKLLKEFDEESEYSNSSLSRYSRFPYEPATIAGWLIIAILFVINVLCFRTIANQIGALTGAEDMRWNTVRSRDLPRMPIL